MSDVAHLRQVRPARPHLPVSWYFDTAIFELEKKLLFDAGSNYVGHELMVPNVGDYHTLAHTDHSKVLVRNANGVELLSNVCRHRQAIMLQGRGNIENIVCPLHRWTYDLKGELLGAPFFEETPCVRLHSTPLINWNGLLFTGPRDPRKDLAHITTNADWNFDGYVLDSVRVDEYDMNWKTFVETYLEVYHVNFFHPGLGNFTDCDNFTVDYGDEHSIQVVAAKAGLQRPGTPVYRKWHDACLQQLNGATPKYGALWAAYYPGLTFEWYPNVLIVSHLIPRSPSRTTNVVEFYYPEEIVHFEREFIEAQQAAYVETALEDYEICQRLDRGRRSLYEAGNDDAGPYHAPMETAEVHFHEWLHRKLGR
jgi:choline monooxygenase